MRRNKGFTLIELIVVIAIIGILVGLSTGLYKGYTKEAKLTEYKNNIKVLGQASEQYYMKEGKWPRQGEFEDHFTSEQLETYAEKIYDITGEEPELDPDGKYYEINYKDLSKYVQIPKEKGNYILQNPVGDILYLNKITEAGEDNLTNYTPQKTEKPQETPEPVQPIIFQGLGSEAFDGNPITGTTTNGTITWTGNLVNRKVTVDLFSSQITPGYGTKNITMYDTTGKQLKFINLTTGIEVSQFAVGSSYPSNARGSAELLIPEGAVKFVINGEGRLYDITVGENSEHPKDVTNLKSTSTSSSISLTWENDDPSYEKAVIYRDGVFLKIVTEKTYTDTPLYSDSEHKYEIRSISVNGNGSLGLVTYTVRTETQPIEFKGLSASAFDNNTSTYASIGTVTWNGNLSNKKIKVDISSNPVSPGGVSNILKIYDSAGKQLNFINLTSGSEVSQFTVSSSYPSSARGYAEIIVPEGAVKFEFSGSGRVYDITPPENTEQPTSVTNIQSEPLENSIKLTWESTDSNYAKSAIYRDGSFIKVVAEKTYTDTRLQADREYTYEIHAINSYGNASRNITTHTARTVRPEVLFNGLNLSVFDGDVTTGYQGKGTVTWEGDPVGKIISITLKSGVYIGYSSYPYTINFKDINGNNISFYKTTGEYLTSPSVGGNGSTVVTVKYIVPEGTTQLVFTGGSNASGGYQGYIYEVSMEDTVE